MTANTRWISALKAGMVMMIALTVLTNAQAAAETVDIKISPAGDFGYFDRQGRYVIDMMQEDYAYISVRIETADGRPVAGVEPEFSMEGTSQLLKPQDLAGEPRTNEDGVIEFAVIGGEMSLDLIRVAYGEATFKILVNVISLRATTFLSMVVEGEDFLNWDMLMQARTRYEGNIQITDFPAAVSEQSGKTARLSGFVMPLEASMKQSRFLLTSHPPECFFHAPGGVSGTVEVIADESIKVSTWEAIMLEGRFEAITETNGAIYRLHDARLIKR